MSRHNCYRRWMLVFFSFFPLSLATAKENVRYGIPQVNEVKEVMHRVLEYVDESTPVVIVDSKTLQEIARYKDINEDSRIKLGGYKMVCYEWGVTYSAMLSAWQATGDETYMQYLYSRLSFLDAVSPYFEKLRKQGKRIDPQMNRWLAPHSLDDSGALCSAMIKTMLSQKQSQPSQQSLQKSKLKKQGQLGLQLENHIKRLSDCVVNRQSKLSDGTFCRDFPQRNAVWLDDMFMGIPTLAWMGRYTGDSTYYNKATQMIRLYRKHSFVEDKQLFRHGWVEAMEPHRFYPWARANGWAILTMCEVLDALPENHPDRAWLLELYRRHVAGIVACQGINGFWHQLLDRTDTYEETSATAIFAYCLAHGINEGWINDKAYGPQALLAWNAVASAVNEKGQVEGVCVGTGMGFDPLFYQRRKTDVMAAHGYGPAIWAGAEIIRLLQTHHPKVNDGAVEFYDEEIETDQAIFHVK